MSVSDNHERFIAYLTGRLTPGQIAELESELEGSEELRLGLERFRSRHERAALARHARERRAREMATVSHLSPEEQIEHLSRKAEVEPEPPAQPHHVPHPPAPRRKVKLYYYAAAAAAISLAITLGYHLLQQEQVPDELFALEVAESYYQPAEVGGELRRANDTLATARDLYKAADYLSVIKVLEPMRDRSPEASYLLAHAYFSNEEFPRSAELFDQLAVSSSNLKNVAEWNGILAYLSDPDSQETARRKLAVLAAKQNQPYAEVARELQAKLDR